MTDNERGATAVEYGLIMGLVTLALLAALTSMADTVVSRWDDLASTVTNL